MSDSNRETEVKFYVGNLPDIETRLQPPPPFGHLPQIRNKMFYKFLSFYSRIWGRLGGGLIQPRVLEIKLRFDNSDGDFQREGRVLRLRRDDAIRLTYKDGSQLLDGALSRREIEFAVSDFDSAKQFIEALGYKVFFVYEKFRATFELDDAHIMLDETPIGNFIEIEGAMEALKPIAKKLGLNWDAAIPASYHALFERVCEARGLSFRDLSFENFKGMKVSPDDLGVKPAD